jgi:hypothetical protein
LFTVLEVIVHDQLCLLIWTCGKAWWGNTVHPMAGEQKRGQRIDLGPTIPFKDTLAIM